MRIAVLDSNHFEMEITGKKLFSELELIKTPCFIILFKCIDTKLNNLSRDRMKVKIYVFNYYIFDETCHIALCYYFFIFILIYHTLVNGKLPISKKLFSESNL